MRIIERTSRSRPVYRRVKVPGLDPHEMLLGVWTRINRSPFLSVWVRTVLTVPPIAEDDPTSGGVWRRTGQAGTRTRRLVPAFLGPRLRAGATPRPAWKEGKASQWKLTADKYLQHFASNKTTAGVDILKASSFGWIVCNSCGTATASPQLPFILTCPAFPLKVHLERTRG